MKKVLVTSALLAALGGPAAADWNPLHDSATTGYSPTCPFPVETVWHLAPGMTPCDYQSINNGGYYNSNNYYYNYGPGYAPYYPSYSSQQYQQSQQYQGAAPSNCPQYGEPGFREPSFRQPSRFR